MQEHRGGEGKQIKAIGRSTISNLIFVPLTSMDCYSLVSSSRAVWALEAVEACTVLTLIVFMSV